MEQKEDELHFRLCANEETLKEYPYLFELHVRYTLKENEVKISYEKDSEKLLSIQLVYREPETEE